MTPPSAGPNLTKHLLAFARKQPLQPREIDVNPLMLEAAKLLHPTLGEQIQISPLLAQDAWTALVDPNQLTTAILNLALNARDAMPDGGKLVLETRNVYLDEGYASMHSEVTPGNYVMIAVSDTGSGISAANLERVFDPFFTTKEVGKGTGLGLSMVFGFVKQSGGHIKIYSEEGHGTTVKIYLPRSSGLHQTDDRDDGGFRCPRRPRSRPHRRGRSAGAQICHHPDPEPRLHHARGGQRDRGARYHRQPRRYRSVVHRRDHARPDERPPSGRSRR